MRGGDGTNHLYGQLGNDLLIGGANTDYLYGASGDDELRGMSGNDVMDGGDGNDIVIAHAGRDFLSGGNGRDLLIGGLGQDALWGAAGEDILIDGFTTFDAGNVDFDAAKSQQLHAIRDEWASDRNYEHRVSNIHGQNNGTFDERLNGDNFLIAGATVFHDFVGDIDALHGQGDRDWFMYAVGVDSTDKQGNEEAN